MVLFLAIAAILSSCSHTHRGTEILGNPMVGEAIISIDGEEHKVNFNLAKYSENQEKRDATLIFSDSDPLGGLILTQKGESCSASFGELSLPADGLGKILEAICILSPFEPTKSGITDDGQSFIIGSDGRKLIFSSDGTPKELHFKNIYVKIIWIKF